MKKISDCSIIVKDICDLKKEVIDLRNSLGFPSIKIMQFGKSTFREDKNLPHKFTDTNVCFIQEHMIITLF